MFCRATYRISKEFIFIVDFFNEEKLLAAAGLTTVYYRFIEKKRVENVTVLNPFQSSNLNNIRSQDLHQNKVGPSLFTKVAYDWLCLLNEGSQPLI